MPVTELDVLVLSLLARYYVLTREQIQSILFPDHASGRSTRRRLTQLRHAGLIKKHPVPVALPGAHGGAPVYYCTKQAGEILAEWHQDDRYLRINTRHPRPDRLNHWVMLNETRRIIEAAVARQSRVTLDRWINEWEVVDPATSKKTEYFLHTQLSVEPPLSCSPDAGILLSAGNSRKVFYIERDLGTSSPRQVVARKSRGYAELARREGHRRHFPETTLPNFSVLVVTTSKYRVDQIAKHLGRCEGKELWRLINAHELTPETFLHGDIVYDHHGDPGPLVKPGVAS